MPENTRKKAADGARPDPSGKGKQKRKRNKEADRKALEKIRAMEAEDKRKSERGYRFMIKGARGVIKLLVTILIIVAIAWLGRSAYVLAYAVVKEAPKDKEPGKTVSVTIPDDASAREIANILYDNGLIDDKIVFICQERISGYHGKEIGGTYELNSSEAPNELLARLSGEEPEDDESSS